MCVYLCVYVSLYIFIYMYIFYLWVLLGHEKEWNSAIGDSRDGTWWHCAKWDKSDRAHILKTFTILLPYCLWGSQDKNTGVVCHSFSSGPRFVTTLRYPSWVALCGMAYSFLKLHKAVILLPDISITWNQNFTVAHVPVSFSRLWEQC